MGQRPSGISIRIREDLVAGSARTQTTLICDPIITLDGHRLVTADIGDICFAKINQGTSNEEIISFTGITDNTSTYTLTGCVWGYNFYNSTGSVEANKKKQNSGASFVITDDDHYLTTQYVNADSDQTIGGAKTFSVTPKSTAGDPLVATDLVVKSYVDALVLGTLTTINVIVPGKAGETVAAGQLMYFDLTDNEWKLTDANTAATVENVLLGIAQGAGTNGNAITDGILLQGVDDNQSGLTEGDVYYASDTAGAIANTAGTVEMTVGLGKSATELYFNPRFNQQITEDQQDALAGTSGTPSSTNKYVTNDDTAENTASKLVRRKSDSNITVPTTPTTDTDATSKSYVDNNSGSVLCTAGIDITSGQAVSAYADGKIYPTDASVANGTNFVGFALADIAANATGYIKYAGFATKSGLTPAATYYLSDATTSSVGYAPTADSTTATDDWQSFTTGASQTHISKVTLGLTGTSSATDTMRLYSGEGTGGTLLATVTWTGNPGSSSYAAPASITFQLANPIPVSPSSTYTIRWSVPSAHNWVYKTAGAYAGGRAGGNAAWDMNFSVVYYNVAGAIGTSAGSTSKKIGMAVTSTQLLIKHDNT